MSDGSIRLRYTPEGENARRVRFEPDGPGVWDRIEEERRDGCWCVTGHERVTGLSFDAPCAAYSDDDPVTTFRGP